MKYLILLLFLISCNCPNNLSPKVKTIEENKVEGEFNTYELIRIGKYECVGMDGHKSGGVWCNKIEELK